MDLRKSCPHGSLPESCLVRKEPLIVSLSLGGTRQERGDIQGLESGFDVVATFLIGYLNSEGE